MDFSLFFFASDGGVAGTTATACCWTAPGSPTPTASRRMDAGTPLPPVRRPVPEPGGHRCRGRRGDRAGRRSGRAASWRPCTIRCASPRSGRSSTTCRSGRVGRVVRVRLARRRLRAAPGELRRPHERRSSRRCGTVRRLWRGEAVDVRRTATGEQARRCAIFPAPVQPELPVWVTSPGQRGDLPRRRPAGAGVLTHLLGQDQDDAGRQHRARTASARTAGARHVALMVHTLIGADARRCGNWCGNRSCDYLRGSLGLIAEGGSGLRCRPGSTSTSCSGAGQASSSSGARSTATVDDSGLFGTIGDGARDGASGCAGSASTRSPA